ncbi:MAG: radical SAM protein [Elusimicrobiota bacterium]
MRVPDIARLAGKVFFKTMQMPEYITFFVTGNCNCSCGHCFNVKNSINTADELSYDEIRQISQNAGRFFFLNLTGGEPYLRSDLPEIVYIFAKNNGVQTITTPTNGLLSDNIAASVEKILKKCRNIQFSVDIAIDGIKEEHDNIRGHEGVFSCALETFRMLKEVKKRYKNLNLGVNITFSAANQENIKKTYDYVFRVMQPDSITVILTRGYTRDKAFKAYNPDYYRDISNMEENDYSEGQEWGGDSGMFSKIYVPFNMLRRKIILKTLEDQSRQVQCYAGKMSAVIQSNGDVFPCELLDMKIGNLRESGYSLKKLVFSEEARTIRAHIRRTKCYCTHECNLLTNILFNPLKLTDMLCRTLGNELK